MISERDIQRFWSMAAPVESGCLEWQGGLNHNGYGRINIGGRGGKRWLAHRLAYTLTHGPIPDGMVICHRCDNPPCVNPEHLFLGTQADNLADAAAKRRIAAGDAHGMNTKPERRPRGERNGNAVLTAEDVMAMRHAYAAGGVSYGDLGQRYGISRTSARDAVIGRRWKHLPLARRATERGMPEAQPYPCACPVCCPTLVRSAA